MQHVETEGWLTAMQKRIHEVFADARAAVQDHPVRERVREGERRALELVAMLHVRPELITSPMDSLSRELAAELKAVEADLRRHTGEGLVACRQCAGVIADVVGWLTHPQAADPDVSGQADTDTREKVSQDLPSNSKVLLLATKLRKAKPKRGQKTEFARQFAMDYCGCKTAKEADKAAKSLLRQVRRYPRVAGK